MKKQAPCLGCNDRVAVPNCHSTCEKYIKYDTENKEIKAINGENYRIYKDIDELHFKSKHKESQFRRNMRKKRG